MEPSPEDIAHRYLLVTNVPFWRGDDGRLLAPELWWKDLNEHLRYLPRLHVAAPTTIGPCNEQLRPVDELPPLTLTLLPARKSFLHAMLTLPTTITRIWRAVGLADVVHCGVAGWPYPMGWLAAPIARLREKFLVVIVESAPWRTDRPLRRILYERLAKWCLHLAHASFFTQTDYHRSLLPNRPERGHVIHASWVDASRILADDAATESWDAKPTEPLKLLFAGRLAEGKGVRILLDAMTRVRRADVTLDLLGAGDLDTDCRRAADASSGRIRMLGTLPYDDRFFAALRPYHAVVVPSIGDEQPRIVYDAYSQAVPVIASGTPGLRDCVRDGHTGTLVPTADPAALAAAIDRATPAELRRMGLASLAAARDMTHTAMHARRADILRTALAEYDRRR